MTIQLDPKRYDVAIKQLQKLLSETDIIVQKQTTIIAETQKEFAANKELVTGIVGEFEILKANVMTTDVFLADSVNAATGSFSKYLTGVNIVGDMIKGGTIATERLIIRDPETNKGILYEINNGVIDQTNLTEEELKRLCLDGKILVAESVTADKINVTDLFSQNITATGNFNLGEGGALVYDADTDTLTIRAKSILMSSGMSVESAIENAQESADEAYNEIEKLSTWSHTAFSIDEGKTLVETVINGSLQSGAINDDGTDDNETAGYFRTDYIRVIPGETYTWQATDNEEATLPTTYFYESEDGSSFTFLSSVDSSQITVPASNVNVYIRATLLSASEIELLNGILVLNDLDSHLSAGAVLHLGEITTLTQTPPYLAEEYLWSLPDNEMQAYMADLLKTLDESFTGSLEELSDKLYASEGSIPKLQEELEETFGRLGILDGYVDIDPGQSTIKLGKKSSPAKVVITNKDISFQNNGVEGASIGYVDENKTSMMASSIHVTENFPRAKVDGEWVGNLCWIARSNGHYSLKVVK